MGYFALAFLIILPQRQTAFAVLVLLLVIGLTNCDLTH